MNNKNLNVFIQDNLFTECTESSYLYNKVKFFFRYNNYNLVDSLKEADLLLLNTCGVFDEFEDKIFNYLSKIKAQNNNLMVGVFGCLAGRSKKIKSIVDYAIPTKMEKLFDNYFFRIKSIEEITSYDINKGDIKLAGFYNDNTRKYFLEINRGCIHNCNYCAIKFAIGYVKSKPILEIKEEFKKAVKEGYNEIVLVSDDVGSYGYDINLNFSELFNEITKIKGDYIINIVYTDPGEFAKIFPLIKDNFYRVKEINYPVQSFSNRILSLMNRKYNIEDVIRTVDLMRQYSKGIKIFNHIIFAYPTETMEEFKQNLSGARYFDANIFNLYSYIKGTKKYLNSELLSRDEIKKRFKILLKLNKIDNNKFDIANRYEKSLQLL